MHERYAVWHELAIENSADIRQSTFLEGRSVMTGDKERFEKVLAVAINPGAYEGEAIAALRKCANWPKGTRRSQMRRPLLDCHCPPVRSLNILSDCE